MRKIEFLSPNDPKAIIPQRAESYASDQSQTNSIASRKSNPRTLYFKKQYKLLIHRIHIKNNISFLSLTSDIGRVNKYQCESVYNFQQIIELAVMNAIKGTQDFINQNVTLYIKSQNQKDNFILGLLKFDMTKEKMLRQDSPKIFQKMFQDGSGYIQYKFISYANCHLKSNDLNDQKQLKNQVLLNLNQTKDNQFQELLKFKDQIIKELENKINQLIDDSKKIKKSLSKEKEKFTAELASLRTVKNHPNIFNKRNGGSILGDNIFRKNNRVSLMPQTPLARVLSADRVASYRNTPIEEVNEQFPDQRHNSGLNINIKVLSSKTRQKEVEHLKEVAKIKEQLETQVERLRQQNGILTVQNKQLRQKVQQSKLKYQRAIQNKYNQLLQQHDQIRQVSLKQSINLSSDRHKKMKVSGFYGSSQPGEQFLTVGKDLNARKKQSQAFMSKSFVRQFIQDKNLDPFTINLVKKLEHEKQMISSKLSIKQEQCQKLMQQLTNCTIQLKKKSQQVNQIKLKFEQYKKKGGSFRLDSSDEHDMQNSIQNMKSSQKQSIAIKISPGEINYDKYDKAIHQMKQSIISYEQKIQETQIELMKSRIVEQTLQKQKALYENKYVNILQTLESNKQKYLQAMSNSNQVEALKNNNEQIRKIANQVMQKYQEQNKLRMQSEQKVSKIKQKYKQMFGQWQRLKQIQTQYESLKRRSITTQKSLLRFQTTLAQLKKFVLKLENSYYNVTKKSKKNKQEANEEELQQMLQENLARLNQVEEQYYDNMRQFYQYQKEQLNNVFEKKMKFEFQKIQLLRDTESQKLIRKQAVQEALQSQRKSKRKKIDAKIKALLQARNKNQEENQKQGVSLYDKIKTIQRRLRSFDQKLADAPNYKIKITSENDKGNLSPNTSRNKSRTSQQEYKEMKQKIEKLELENDRLKKVGKQSIFSGGKLSGYHGQGKSSQNPSLQMNKSQLGGGLAANLAASESIIKEQRKSMLDQMNKNREVFTKSFEDIKKQNTQLMRKKSQLQIQVQNYRFREQKIIMKQQQRERDLQRMAKASNDDLLNTKDQLQAKLQKIEKQHSVALRQNQQYTQGLTTVVMELKKVSSILEQKQAILISTTEENNLLKQRIYTYQEAQRKMMIQIQLMKYQVAQSQTNFNHLFEERNAQFLKIQKIKSSQIQKLKKLTKNLEDRIQNQLTQQLKLKLQIQNLQNELKRIEQVNLGLQESQKVMQSKYQNLRKNSTEELMKLDQQNQALRYQLMKLAQQASTMETELQRSRLTIQSLQKQVQVLEPVYNQMCQMQLKNQSQKQKYQDIMTRQNQKFLQLRQKYEKIQSYIKQIQEENKSLRIRDLQFEQIRINLNDKIFQKQRLCLQIQKEKHDAQFQKKKISDQLKQTIEKQNHYVLENHELQIQIEELHKQLTTKNNLQQSAMRSRFRQGDSFIDNNLQSRVNPRNQLGGTLLMSRNELEASKLKSSRNNSKVLSRSRNFIQSSRNFAQSHVIGSRHMQRSNSHVSLSRKLSNISGVSINPITTGNQKQSRFVKEEMESPFVNFMKDDLHKIDENIEEMKGTFLGDSKARNKSLKQQLLQINKISQKQFSSKNLNDDLQIDEVSNSLIKSQEEEAAQNEQDENQFHSFDQSEFHILIQLQKVDIIERVHQLKSDIVLLMNDNQNLKQQIIKLGGHVEQYSQKQYGQQYQLVQQGYNQSGQQYPKIQIHTGNRISKNSFNEQSSSINNYLDHSHMKKQNNKSSSGQRAQQNFLSKFKNVEGINSRSKIQTFQLIKKQQKLTRLKQQLNQKQLVIQQQKQQIHELQQKLLHQKQNSQRLFTQVECLIKDTQQIQFTLKQKNKSIQNLNKLLIEQQKKYQNNLEKLLEENVERDNSVREMAQRCDQLQQSKQKAVKDKIQTQEKYKKYVKQYQKIKKRQKANQKSYKQYEQQSQLQILKLKQQIDKLVEKLINKKQQIYQLAQRYVILQTQIQELKLKLLQKSTLNTSQKQKFTSIIQKYRQISQKLQKSEKQRRQGSKLRQQLQSTIKQNQITITELHKKTIMSQKKYQSTITTQQQHIKQLKRKNQQYKDIIIQLKHQISVQNEQLVVYKKENESLQQDLIKIQKQLKDIMQSYQRQFHFVQGKKHTVIQELNQHHSILIQRDKDLESIRRQKRSLEGELYKIRNELFQLNKQYQMFKRKHQHQIKELSEKYQYKNHDFQMLKQKVDKQIDTTTETIIKQTNREKKLEAKLQEFKKIMKQKDTIIQHINIKIKEKQFELNKKKEGSQQKQKMLTNKVKQLEAQIKNLNSQIKQGKVNSYKNQTSYVQNHHSAIESLNSQLAEYSGRVQQLQRQNFYLRRQNEKYLQTLQEIKSMFKINENKMKQKIYELQDQVEFYKAKRLDQLNKLLNQTDD